VRSSYIVRRKRSVGVRVLRGVVAFTPESASGHLPGGFLAEEGSRAVIDPGSRLGADTTGRKCAFGKYVLYLAYVANISATYPTRDVVTE